MYEITIYGGSKLRVTEIHEDKTHNEYGFKCGKMHVTTEEGEELWINFGGFGATEVQEIPATQSGGHMHKDTMAIAESLLATLHMANAASDQKLANQGSATVGYGVYGHIAAALVMTLQSAGYSEEVAEKILDMAHDNGSGIADAIQYLAEHHPMMIGLPPFDVNAWEVESLMDVCWTEKDASYDVPFVSDDDNSEMAIHVHKLGGGDVGKEYDGSWICELLIAGHVVHSGRVETGTPRTHEHVSGVYADGLSVLADKDSGGLQYIPEFAAYEWRLKSYAIEVNN
ncbi:hypothetical protein [Actinomadura rubrisoli]|uniref:Uncharacterized protein n=1 Tax=Actinomadura rubrisoli TaxID=2530368 RepID=A0A4R5CB87_9ACTN|nr:hypothetical protein [Actinomadura rubrisoli]TDD97211.1 hypothetical protein E1298_01880 [Actinomadura rubrisoli]